MILFSLSFYWKPGWVLSLCLRFHCPSSFSAESTQEVPLVFMSLVAQHAPWTPSVCPSVKDACLCIGYCCKHEGSIGNRLREHLTPIGSLRFLSWLFLCLKYWLCSYKTPLLGIPLLIKNEMIVVWLIGSGVTLGNIITSLCSSFFVIIPIPKWFCGN